MEKDRPVHRGICQMMCLIAAQFFYLTAGSAVFMFLEQSSAVTGYNNILDDLLELQGSLNLTKEQERVLSKAFGVGLSFNDKVLPSKCIHAWDFISTLYFSITSTTTIGYGHHSPATTYGQIFCIMFSFLGIPLHMVTLGTIGRYLNIVISRFLQWIGRDSKEVSRELGTFLVTSALLVLFIIFSAGSVRLMIEGVSYVEAVYFIFVTVSTIGFGDFVIRFEDQADHNRLLILCVWAFAVYFGMSILSATIMSVMARAKQNYRAVFRLWDAKVLGKKWKKITNRKCDEGMILVDKEFLVAQLLIVTDPEKKAEIQCWIDKCIGVAGDYSDYYSSEEEYGSNERSV